MTMPVLAIQQNNGAALQEFFRAVLLDSENKVPSEALRIVGALSAGHIIESGDNANGYYVRFADGLQICYIDNLLAKSGGTGISAAYVEGAWTFPAAYISFPAVVGCLADIATNTPCCQYSAKVQDNTTVLCRFRTIKDTAITGSQIARCIAIGRWKE